MKRVSTVAAFATLALIAAACGSDDESATTDPAPTATAAPATDAAPGTDAAPATDAAPVTDAAPTDDCQLDEPLRIGYAADFDLGGIGDVPATNAAQFVVDQVNADGGVGGHPVEYEIKQISQTPPDPAAAQRAVQELIDGGADIILGPPFSDYGLPLLEVTKGEVPVLFVTSTEITLSDPSQGSFLVSFNDRVQASAAAEFATKQGFTTAVTMSSTDIPYLNITTAAFAEVFTGAGGSVSTDLSFNLGDSDFSSQVNEIAGLDPQPDVIYSAFFLPEAGIFLKQLREAGVESAVISADGFDASLIWTIGADAEGVFFTSHTFPGEGNNVQQFLDDYAAAGGPAIETVAFGALGADAAQIAIAATQAACSTDGAALIEAIGGLTVDVTTGTTSYVGTSGTPKRDVAVLTVTDGAPALADSFFPTVVAAG
jgi:branched-chain amino acid transport system substrate-binding protein